MLRTPALTLILLGIFTAFPISALAMVDAYSSGPGLGNPDLLDDVWQSTFHAWGMAPNDDEDQDGCTNLQESTLGTNPRDPSDCLKVGKIDAEPEGVTLRFGAKRGKKYQVWESNSPGGPAPGEEGSSWIAKTGTFKIAAQDGPDSLAFAKPAGGVKFYRLEVTDHDDDQDGVSDWAENRMGTDAQQAFSTTNASGGVASDLETLRSLMTLQVSAGAVEAFEKEASPATIQLRRSYGTMPLTVELQGLPGATLPTKSSADPNDYLFQNVAGQPTDQVTLPNGQGTTTPFTVARVMPMSDSAVEVPEALKVTAVLPGASVGEALPSTTIQIKDANPTVASNRVLYVAFLGREAGITSTASGYATALVEGDNTRASISVVFNNLSSDQNTAYVRVGPDLEVQVLPLGQVSGANWNIRAAQTELTDQRMLDALRDGKLYIAITTVNYPEKEIYGYFNLASGTELFDENRPELQAPNLGSAQWPNPQNEALERDIWRFMNQATFGGTTALYQEIRAEVDATIAGGGTYLDGLSNWMDKQMNSSLTPPLNYRQLVMASDMEEFALRGNKPITYNGDPQQNGGTLGVTFMNGMPMVNYGNPDTNSPGNNHPNNNGGAPNRRREWWSMITQSRDQLRQRVTQALSEICVISERDAGVMNWHYGAANWWDMLASGAFGKYRTLLEQVSLNPMMGIYLTSIANRAEYVSGGITIFPDENYAREIMQLFSIGLVLRHPDGSLKLSTEGLPIATYDNNDITELARVFTGFSHGVRHGVVRAGIQQGYGGIGTTEQRISPTLYSNGSTNNVWFGRQDGHPYWQAPWIYPMVVIGRQGSVVYHDFGAKTLLSGKHSQLVLNATNITGMTDAQTHAAASLEVSRAHDGLAGSASATVYGDGSPGNPGHTNTPVNISRWLIQRLVTSNPSAGYIYRVQKAYRDSNGTLGQVVKAILLDHEARNLTLADNSISHGKVKEPLIHFAHILRLFRAYSGAPVSVLRDMETAFSETDAPVSKYPASELAKFDSSNVNPPSMPTGWQQGPFRYRLDSLRSTLGQSPLDAPSVFNWFYPDFTLPGRLSQMGLFAPEMQTINEGAEIAKINFLYSYMWMNLSHMVTQPGVGVADFIIRNGWATPALRFSTNGGSTLLNWPASIVLNESNWQSGVTVTLVGVNDRQMSPIAGSQIRYALSGAAGFSGVSTLPTDLRLVDNEVPNERLIINPTGGGTWITEGGASDRLSIRLSAPPAVGAVVTVTPASTLGQVAVSPNQLNFDHTNWATYQTLTLVAVQDAVPESSGTSDDAIAFVVTSPGSANYHNLQVPTIAVPILDDDGGVGVLITESSDNTQVTENGNTDSYTVQLTSNPIANVTVRVTCASQMQVNTTGTTYASTRDLVFVPSSATPTSSQTRWNVPQTVVLRANNDSTIEGNHTSSVSHSILTTIGDYSSSLSIPSITTQVTDDDNPIIINTIDGELIVMEGTDPLVTDTLAVRLRTNPSASVSITLSAPQLRFSPSTLIFEPTGSSSNLWSTEQTVTVSALDDFIQEGLHSVGLVAYSQSAGSNYNGSTSGNNIPVTLLDNDDARLVITQTQGSTTVGEADQSDTYSLALGRKPAAGTEVTATVSGFSGITVSPPGPFVFNESNWNTPVVITVRGSNDSSFELPITQTTITHTVTSTDPVYHHSSSPTLTVTMVDNEPALTINQTNLFTQISEGGTPGTGGTPNASDTFTIAPARTPAAGNPVTITLTTDGQTSVSPATLTFTSTTAQTVTVTAVDDSEQENASHLSWINFSLRSSDPYFNGTSVPPVFAYVQDNDKAGIVIMESGGTTTSTEGGTTADAFSVSLTRAPSANVSLIVNGGSQSRLSTTGTPNASSVTLNFTPTNWGTQSVNVLAFNDTQPELRHLADINLTIDASSAAEYASLAAASVPKITHIISDDDGTSANARIRITETSNSTGVTESGATINGVASSSDTVSVVLSQQPTAPVTIAFTTDGQVTVSPSVLTFIPGATGTGTFNTAQTLTIQAVDDTSLEPLLHWGRVTAIVTSNDAFFSGATVPVIASSVYDNDGPSVTISHTQGSTILTEAGRADTYTVTLSHAPTSDVAVNLTPDAQITTSPASLIFTPTDWAIPQGVTVTATNDSLVEATTHSGAISHSVTSLDPAFNGISAATLTAQIWDNDSPGLEVSHAGTDANDTVVTEGGTNDSIVLRLTQAPPAGSSVTVSLYPPAFYVPPPQHGKVAGYFANDQGTNNNRDNIVIDYTESIVKYRQVFYDSLRSQNGGIIPASPAAAQIQNAHWQASKTLVDQMDLWFNGGSMKARNPVLIEPNQALPTPLPIANARQAIIEAVYAHSGGSSLPSTTRYEAETIFNPKNPPTSTFANEIRDRVRWAGYLMSVGAPGLISH